METAPGRTLRMRRRSGVGRAEIRMVSG